MINKSNKFITGHSMRRNICDGLNISGNAFAHYFHFPFHIIQFVGDKVKGWISKWVFQENKGRQIFRKTNIAYPLITFVFRKIWRVLFSWNTRFGIRPFALLPTNSGNM